MKQLMMKWKNTALPEELPLGQGITLKTFSDELREDLNTALMHINEGRLMTDQELDDCIVKRRGVNYDGIFLAYLDGKVVGTTTAVLNLDKEVLYGTVHMVSVLKEASGRKLGKILCRAVMDYLLKHDCAFINLTTDDFRIPAVKTYLDLGFLPVLYDSDMSERWSKMLKLYGIESVPAYETLIDREPKGKVTCEQ